jgi:hypothetical protein
MTSQQQQYGISGLVVLIHRFQLVLRPLNAGLPPSVFSFHKFWRQYFHAQLSEQATDVDIISRTLVKTLTTGLLRLHTQSFV